MSDSKAKTKRPGNTAFKQQRLKAWQPILTPKTVIPTFLVIGAIFIPIGIGLYIASDRVSEVIFDYSQCSTAGADFARPNVSNVGPIESWKYDSASKNCTIRFNANGNFEPPIFMYYRLTNFYQNHRRYVKSFDPSQLKGNLIEKNEALTQNCEPRRNASKDITTLGNVTLSSDAQYYPCGLIADSFFTDTISNLSCVSTTSSFKDGVVCTPGASNNAVYNFVEKGIAWPSDSEKFGKTEWTEKRPDDIPKYLVPPENWRTAWNGRFANGYTKDNIPDLKSWERLQVWMRTAGLPNFRKLWGRNDDTPLVKGVWELTIQDTFNVTRFGGTKSIVISTVSILGGKNPFLGIAYLVVGSVCILLGVLFLARHMIKPRKMGDHNLLSWNKDPLQRTEGANGNSRY